MRIFLAIILSLISSVAIAAPFKQTCPGDSNLCAKPTCSYPIPSPGNTIGVAYSFRKLVPTWTGFAMNVRRDSDAAVKDMGFSANACDFDAATWNTFCNGTTCRIRKWYNQTATGSCGNNSDAAACGDVTQLGTSTTEPTITLNCQNGKPCGVFDSASSQNMSGALPNSTSATAATYMAVAQYTDLSGVNNRTIAAIGPNTTNGSFLGYSVGAVACAIRSINSSISTQATENCSTGITYRFLGTVNATGRRLFLNGAQGIDGGGATIPSETATSIGSFQGNNLFKGDIMEVIIGTPDLTDTDAKTISTNQKNYWGTN